MKIRLVGAELLQADGEPDLKLRVGVVRFLMVKFPGRLNNPEESIQHVQHDESLKSRLMVFTAILRRRQKIV